MRKLLFILLAFYPVFLFAATDGIIKGVVKDKKTGETLVGVNVYIEGTQKGASTDLNGEYVINNVHPGTYRIVSSIISYKKLILGNVIVSSGNVISLNIEMEEEINQMQEVVIVDKRVTGSEISIINTIKSTSLIANGISSQQILKAQDRDASEVIRRVPGITIFNGRFVIVRGLNQRYNTVFLNNASTPSAESDARSFSFDIIPSSMIDNIMIYKTPSPELPADFSGAFIDIYTRNTPNKNSTDASLSLSYNDLTTFHTFYKYKGGSLDFLGVDDGTRALPKGFPGTTDFKTLTSTYTPEAVNTITELGREMNNTWTAGTQTTLPDLRLNLGLSRKFKIGSVLAGNITALSYTNTNLYLSMHRQEYQVYNFTDDKPSPNFDFQDDVYRNTAKIGLIFNWSFVLNPSNKISFQNLFNNIGYTQTTLRQGEEYYSSQMLHGYEYSFKNRLTYSGQLIGEHDFGKSVSHLKWTLGYSYTNTNDPMQKRLTTVLNTSSGDPFYNHYGLQFSSTPSPKYAGMVYQTLYENIVMGKVDFIQPINISGFKPELKAGVYSEYKTRTFNARLLGFIISKEDLFDSRIAYKPFDSVFSSRYINSTDGIKLAESTNPSDSYTADNTQVCGYITLKLPVFKWMTVYGGIRVEKNEQVLNSFSSDLSAKALKYDKDKTDLFPSGIITFDISRKSLVRLAYGKTINRPEFREIAPFNFYVFENNASFSGNPDLTDASIHNIEARYELYPTLAEMFSFGIFYKKFIHPIEISYINSGSGLAYGPINAESAESFGAEVELRKNFEVWKEKSGFLHWMSDLSVVFNASLISSHVQFAPGAQERNRYLQGQSPYIINAGLYYQHVKSGWNASLLYNILGKRIIIVGQPNQNPQEDIPDVYEMPFHSLDLTLSKKFGEHWQVKGGIQNILDQNVLYEQTVKFEKAGEGTVTRKQPTLSFNPGKYYTLGISVVF